MSEQKHTNEAAFPVSTIDGFTQYGMNMRDYFAGQALAGLTANPARVGNEVKFVGWAEQAYFFADAMLKVRGESQ